MKTKWLDARIKRYEDWDKHDVIKHNEKLELIELRAIKKQLLLHNVVLQSEQLCQYDKMCVRKRINDCCPYDCKDDTRK